MEKIDDAPNHLLRAELSCPQCGNDVLEAVSDSDETNFLCHGCGSYWHCELNFMIEVRVTLPPEA